jgi:HD-like signal output (HDOD) protein
MHANKARYLTVMEEWFAHKESRLDEIEKDAFGYDHASVGALMAAEWDLSDYVVLAVGGHHKGNGDGKAEPAVKLVAHFRYDNEDSTEALKEKCSSDYGIDETLLNEMINKALDNARDFSL